MGQIIELAVFFGLMLGGLIFSVAKMLEGSRQGECTPKSRLNSFLWFGAISILGFFLAMLFVSMLLCSLKYFHGG